MKNHWSKVFPLLFTYLMWMNVEVQAAASEPPQPETAWFQIEVILFEQTEPNRYIEELWPENPIIPKTTPFAISKKKIESLSVCLEFKAANTNLL